MEMQIQVSGMTCDHCVHAVTEAVRSTASGDVDVAVDLDAGTVTVTGDHLDRAAMAGAIADAGYETAG